MPEPSTEEVTRLLTDWEAGDESALEKLVPLVYDELHRMARGYMRRERPEHTLQATALVHEAYLRLIDQTRVHWRSRSQFFGIAAQQMRRILIDHAREHAAAKHGGGGPRVPLEEAAIAAAGRASELLALDDALRELARSDPRKCRVIELRYFAGLSIEETADVLSVSPITVGRDWALARAWLFREMGKGR